MPPQELPNFDCRFSIARKKRKMPDVDLSNRHPACVRFFDRAKLRSSAENAALVFILSVSPNGYRQIRLSRTGDRISNSSARNLSVVIYVFGGFENGRIAAFKIVEVCGVDAVVPNNGKTITVRVA